MSSIFSLKKRVLSNVQHAIDDLSPIPPELYGRNDALKTLKEVHARLSKIDLDAYLDLKKAKASTVSYFDEPIQEMIERINGKDILGVPHDINRLLDKQVEAPDRKVLAQIHLAQRHLRSSYRNLRLLQSSPLRILMSGWLILAIFVAAALYAVGYFVFAKAGVSHPLSQGGAEKVLQSAKIGARDLRSTISSTGDVLDAAKAFLKKLTDLISAVPALLVAIGAVYAALRKLLIQ